mgnify:CR=1 FL=1
MARTMEHCCKTMGAVLDHDCSAIVYHPVVREYSILNRDKRSTRLTPLVFCPWCGKRMPPPLRSEWLSVFAKLGLEMPRARKPLPAALPKKYTTDAWWRPREAKGSRGGRSVGDALAVGGPVVGRGLPMGERRPAGRARMKHCCQGMTAVLAGGVASIAYDQAVREYYILDKNKRSGGVQCITYCVLCGAKLPKSLRLEWLGECRAFGLGELGLGGVPLTALPKKYTSDAWWRTRRTKAARPRRAVK